MTGRRRYALLAATIVVAAGASVDAAPPSRADCVSSNGTTLCSQGSARGEDNGQGPGTQSGGPYVPYPCAYDWNCGGGGLSIVLSPGSPGISIGRPR